MRATHYYGGCHRDGLIEAHTNASYPLSDTYGFTDGRIINERVFDIVGGALVFVLRNFGKFCIKRVKSKKHLTFTRIRYIIKAQGL